VGSLLSKLTGKLPHDAARRGDSSALKDILDKNPKLVNALDQFGNTALHGAVEKGHIQIIKYLISKGADVNMKDREGRTPLYYAEITANTEVEELLKKYGALK